MYVPILMVKELYFLIPIEVPPIVVPNGSVHPTNVASPSITTREQVASPSMRSGPSKPVMQESLENSGCIVPNEAPLQDPPKYTRTRNESKKILEAQKIYDP
jgi:hypothetical protein